MKRFHFRLESVLRVRRFEFDRTRAQLARLEEERARRESTLRHEVDRLVQGRDLLEHAVREGTDGEGIALRHDAITAGRYRLAQAQSAVEELLEPIAEVRRRLHHARSRVRSLERLKEDAAEKHHHEGLAAEQAELEELALTRIALEQSTPGRAERLAGEGER